MCYVSRVEKGRAIPNVETLEKFANAPGIPLYRLFTDGESVRMPKLLSVAPPTGVKAEMVSQPICACF